VSATAKSATDAIPIVFAVESNPVQLGLVASLNWPGRNVTGVTNMDVHVEGERLRLLHELLPPGTRFALLVNANNSYAERQTTDAEAVAAKMRLQVRLLPANVESELETLHWQRRIYCSP
jgi:putative ABC transport system substrate-binding protein